MPHMDVWNWVLLAIGLYVAITSLAMLMRRRRDQILEQLASRAEDERRRQQRLEELRQAKRTRESRVA